MRFVFIILAFTCSSVCGAQKSNESIQAGNNLYRQQKYEEAQKEYDRSLKTDPSNTTAKFNRANTTYRLGKQDEAIKSYDEINKTEQGAMLRSKTFYNKGAILSRQKKLEESIEAYKDPLRLNPDDKEARENLQKALLELKKKEPPKQKKDDQKKKQDQQKQPQPKMSRKEAEQRLKLLEQKEKEVQQRLQKEKSKSGGSQAKDW